MSTRSSNFKVGVIVPSHFEAKFIEPGEFELTVCGMGKVNGAWAVMELARRGASAILLTGLAGGLRELEIGDVITAEKIMEGDYDASPVETDKHLSFAKRLRARWAKLACMVTQDRFLMKNEYPSAMLMPHPLATDMESYAVAFIGRRLGIPVYIVKIISDVADDKAHADFMKSCTAQAKRLNRVINDSVTEIRRELHGA